ncbi:MAG: UTP--glucose-1-phosphate uridylyltransferase [Parachlamydia sp.]|nr:UTP--glucose-1-phosphate uridylyltransferase [Parachlamydia sp.]
MLSFAQTLNKLQSISQEHLLQFWDSLQEPQRKQLQGQIEALDLEQFQRQQALLSEKPTHSSESYEAFTSYSMRVQKADKERGLQLIASGKVGCLLVAGGQGTRLGFKGPKGMFPISPIKHKSLFQLFAEKTLAASRQAGRPLPLAIMTSPLNHEDTLSFFALHNNFGLGQDQLFFYSQSMLPFLDKSGNLFLEDTDSIAQGPDGNGSALQGLIDSGIWGKWKNLGVQYLNFILIDNPLADPFDAELVGFHDRQASDITVKCTQRLSVDEKVGLLMYRGGKVQVVEYSELPESEREARLPDGSLKHACANISLFCFSAPFLDNLNGASFPLHLAYKDAKALGKSVKAWKFEKFIFDLLPWAENVRALMYPREECFAPLKNSQDPDLIQQALLKMDQVIFARITGVEATDRLFELSQEFYYPTPSLLKNWHKKPLPSIDYIEAGNFES